MVFPVAVRQSPCRSPAFNSIFITCGMPPAWCKSIATYLPDGFKSQNTGIFFRMTSKSSMDNGTPVEWAMASRCKTALVEPPTAITTAMAFSKASRVMMSLGRIFFSIIFKRALALCPVLISLSLSSLAMVEL